MTQPLLPQRGSRGIDGAKGDKGDMPAHEWSGSYLSFENPDGSMGDQVNLRGPQGNQGAGIEPDATGTLADRDAHDEASAGFRFLRAEEGEVLEWYIKNSASAGDWLGPFPVADFDYATIEQATVGTETGGVMNPARTVDAIRAKAPIYASTAQVQAADIAPTGEGGPSFIQIVNADGVRVFERTVSAQDLQSADGAYWVRIFETYIPARASSVRVADRDGVVSTLGYFEPGDGGGARLIHDEGKSEPDLEDWEDPTGRIFVLNEYPPKAEHYGAKGNDLDDDTAAMKRALADDKPLMLTPGRTYLVEANKLVVTKNGKRITSPAGGLNQSAPTIKTNDASGILIELQNPQTTLEKFYLLGPGRTSGLDHLIYGLRPGETAADLDHRIINCGFIGADTLVEVFGRGAIFDECVFDDARYFVSLNYPDTTAAPTGFQNSEDGGARKLWIRDCYFHAASLASIRNQGTHADKVHDINIVGCNQDSPQQRFFIGHFNQSIASGNKMIRANNIGWDIEGARGSVISGMVMTGDRALSDPEFNLNRLSNAYRISGDVDGLSLIGSAVSFSNRSVLQLTSAANVRGLAMIGTSLDNICLDNDTRTDSVVSIESGAAISRSVFADNVATPGPSMANNSSAAFISRSGSGTFSTVYGHNNIAPQQFSHAVGLPVSSLPFRMGDRTMWWVGTDLRHFAGYPSSDSDGGVL